MKLNLEKIPPVKTSSWRMIDRQLDEGIPFEWHHHKEYELTLTLNSRGQRYIGDHMGQYEDEDLVLMGPNLPHTWHSSSKVNNKLPHRAIVMWFTREWAENMFSALPELQVIDELFKRASRGVLFSSKTVKALRSSILALSNQTEANKTINLISILQELNMDTQFSTLASPIYTNQTINPSEHIRIDRVLEYIHCQYHQKLKIDELANLAALSHSGFYRMFLRYTYHKPSDYIIRLRIGKACALLIESHKPIGTISDEAGFCSLANFNRQFKSIKRVTPSEFRRNYSSVARAE